MIVPHQITSKDFNFKYLRETFDIVNCSWNGIATIRKREEKEIKA